MPGHYRSPYGYSYFNPTGKEQAALTIGSLLSGVLAASSGQSRGDAIRKGLAGTMAGYGSGYQNYQNLMGDAFRRDLETKSYGQRIKEYEDSMGLNREKFAEEKRRHAEREPNLPTSVAEWEYGQNIQNPRQRSEFFNRYSPLKTGKQTPLVSVNMGGDAEKEEQKVIGKTLGESYQELQKDAMNARNEIDMFGTLKELSTQTQTGKLEPFKTQLAGYAQALGAPVNARYNANQMFEAISNKLTVMARKVGEGQILAGQISDSDREFLKRSVPELGKLPEANKMLIDWNMKLADRRIQLARLGEEYYNKNGTMKGFSEARTTWINQNPLFPATNISNEQSSLVVPQSMPRESVLQELFDLAQKGDPEALQYFRSKGIK